MGHLLYLKETNYIQFVLHFLIFTSLVLKQVGSR